LGDMENFFLLNSNLN